jgi:hypothetical protein
MCYDKCMETPLPRHIREANAKGAVAALESLRLTINDRAELAGEVMAGPHASEITQAKLEVYQEIASLIDGWIDHTISRGQIPRRQPMV